MSPFFLVKGLFKHEQIQYQLVDSTLVLSKKELDEIEEEWEEIKQKKNRYDSRTARFEGVRLSMEKNGFSLVIQVSSSRYKFHNVLRKRLFGEIERYPNPITVNTILETADDFIIIGKRGPASDQEGLACVGSGFIEWHEETPEHPFDTALRELEEEVELPSDIEIKRNDLICLGLIFGSNHDTAFSIYCSVPCSHESIQLKNKEFSEIIYLSSRKEQVDGFIRSRGLNGTPAADHLIGDLMLYQEFREYITSSKESKGM
ncbi:MAG: hypothetical protein ACXQS8_08575 [Candidatus Helarchaeales archaeon]